MQHRNIEVSFVASTWNPELASATVEDVNRAIDIAHITNPHFLNGIRNIVLDVDEWGLHIYCTERPSLSQMSLWRGIWESMTNHVIHWYHEGEPGQTAQMEVREEALFRRLERAVEILWNVVRNDEWYTEDARALAELRYVLDVESHGQIDDIVNAIAFQVHRRKEGKS